MTQEFGEREEFAALRDRIGSDSNGAAPTAESVEEVAGHSLGIDEIRVEFGIEGAEEEPVDSDYETHYQMAVAFQEMGLMEEAIHEFQAATNICPQT